MGAHAPGATPQRRLHTLAGHLAEPRRLTLQPCEAASAVEETDKVTTAEVALRAVRDGATVRRLELAG
jgi:hypothetical protein